MHVLSKPALIAFWKKHHDAENPLQAWFKTMESKTFAHFKDLRATFASVDTVDDLTVFNIGGNKYRLIARIHYNRKKVYIQAVLTHQEYDRGSWKQKK